MSHLLTRARVAIRLVAVALVVGLVGVGCSSVATTTTTTTTTTTQFDATVLISQLTISPGEAVINTLEVEGEDITFSLFVPSGYANGTRVPVLLALPPGGQTLQNVTEVMNGVYVREAERRGWVVVSPAAPGGVRYFDGAEQYIGPLMDRLEVMFPPEGGKTHLGGMSNGGISAFRIAAEAPDRWASVTVYPGFPQSSSDIDALEDLTDIPITLFVGENDPQWVHAASDTAAWLTELGGDVRYEVIAGDGHVIESLWRGSTLWNAFANARLTASAE